MSSDNRIITITMNPAIDMEAEVETVVPERKMRCGTPRRDPGGGGINVSRVIKRLGGSSTAYYLAGGHYGRRLEELVKEEGIESRRILTGSETRENLVFKERSSEKQYRFLMSGGKVAEEEWKSLLDKLSLMENVPDHVVASGSLPPGVPSGFFRELSNTCVRIGSKLIVDTSGASLKELAELEVFLLKPNRNEFKELAGEGVEELDRQKEEALKIIKKGKVKNIVVSLGHRGALAVSEDECEYVPAPQVMVKSIVGAGDSMLAGIVVSLDRGNALAEAVRFGVACGTAAVLTPGTELCRKEDADRIYKKITKKDEQALT
ncbi:MAG: hexose kinase [Candidatus Omnitrophica bacterium]|nr:hexose kinase [Candidatus Omnitrophota bacterium]